MAYFPDLSRYTYSDGQDDDDIRGGRWDRNVGWLSAEHPFTRGQAPDGFLEALLVCAARPVRLYRGSHDCDLCNATRSKVVVKDLDGREVRLGNGEIRVFDPDTRWYRPKRWYTAPTLVAHYVEDHQYLPPAPFIAGVFAHAKTLYVARGKQLERFRSLGLEERFAACLRVLSALAAHRRTNIERLIPKIQETRTEDPLHDVWCNGWKNAMPPELATLDEVVRMACSRIVHSFSRQYSCSDDNRDENTVQSMARLLEDGADAGLDVTAF